VIDASGVVLAGVVLVGTKGNFGLAKLTHESCRTFTLISVDKVDTGGVILALVIVAVVYVRFAPHPAESRETKTTEPSLFEYFATGAVAARIAVAGVDHEFAIFPVKSRSTIALVVAFRLREAFAAVLAREGEASVAFRHDFVADFACSGRNLESRSRRDPH
jgi:hypothetical protein